MTRGLRLAGWVLAGTTAVVLIAPALMHQHPHGPPHALHTRAMADGAIQFHGSERYTPDGRPLPADLPPSVGPTPAGAICAGAAPAPDPGWAALKYEPPAQLRSTYTRLSDRAFTVRVNGDVDCDGVESTFERRCERGEDGFRCVGFEANIEE